MNEPEVTAYLERLAQTTSVFMALHPKADVNDVLSGAITFARRLALAADKENDPALRAANRRRLGDAFLRVGLELGEFGRGQ